MSFHNMINRFFICIAKSRSGSDQPKLIQGDIVETELVKQMLKGGVSRGAATNNYYHLWPFKNGYREIPYEINSGSVKIVVNNFHNRALFFWNLCINMKFHMTCSKITHNRISIFQDNM